MDLLGMLHSHSTQVAHKPYQCHWEQCGKAFQRRSDLSRHIRIHTNERPFVCPEPSCRKSFIQRSALTVHYRVHTGEKPHRCSLCNRAFSDSSSLARHRRVHTGARPYKCDLANCQRSFCRKTTLLKHQKRNHNWDGGDEDEAQDDDEEGEEDEDDDDPDFAVERKPRLPRTAKAKKHASVTSTPSSPSSTSSFNPQAVNMPQLSTPTDKKIPLVSVHSQPGLAPPIFMPHGSLSPGGSPLSVHSVGSVGMHSIPMFDRTSVGHNSASVPPHPHHFHLNTEPQYEYEHHPQYHSHHHPDQQVYQEHQYYNQPRCFSPSFRPTHAYGMPHAPVLTHSHSFSHALPITAHMGMPPSPRRRLSMPREYVEGPDNTPYMDNGNFEEIGSPLSSVGPNTPATLNNYQFAPNHHQQQQQQHQLHQEIEGQYMENQRMEPVVCSPYLQDNPTAAFSPFMHSVSHKQAYGQ